MQTWTDFINTTARLRFNGTPAENVHDIYVRLSEKGAFTRLFDDIKDPEFIDHFFSFYIRQLEAIRLSNHSNDSNNNNNASDFSDLLQAFEDICTQFNKVLQQERFWESLSLSGIQKEKFAKALEGSFIFKVLTQAFERETAHLLGHQNALTMSYHKATAPLKLINKNYETHILSLQTALDMKKDREIRQELLKKLADIQEEQLDTLQKLAELKNRWEKKSAELNVEIKRIADFYVPLKTKALELVKRVKHTTRSVRDDIKLTPKTNSNFKLFSSQQMHKPSQDDSPSPNHHLHK